MEFITSDTHFGHKNIIKYCNRPFWANKSEEPTTADVSLMDETMIRNWNNVVTPDDVVYHLGDFAFADKQRITEIVKNLNGRKRLVMGNHDFKHSYQFYLDAGFERVYDKPIIWHGFFIMSHEPVFLRVDEIDHGQSVSPNPGLESMNLPLHNFYGHIHQIKYQQEKYYTNCCVECNDYTPVNLTELEEKISKQNE